MKRTWEIGAAGAALVLIFAGCSNTSSTASTAASAAGNAASTAASAASNAASTAASAAGGAASTAAGAASNAAKKAASAAGGAAAGAAGAAAEVASASDGGKVYATNCASCHQAQGQGLPGTFPPLAGNPVVTGDPAHLIHIVKYGLAGKVSVAGHDYNGQMPAWHPTLSDADVAAVVTYIRSSWGNKAGAVTTAQVTAVSQ
jgi:mono/diheme cytochrome c family protein